MLVSSEVSGGAGISWLPNITTVHNNFYLQKVIVRSYFMITVLMIRTGKFVQTFIIFRKLNTILIDKFI